jgi:hypothetical protein
MVSPYRKKIMSTKINSISSLVKLALDAVATYNTGVDGLRAHLSKGTHAEARASLLPHVATYYGTPLLDGQKKALGTKVLDKEHATYEASRKALGRLVHDVMGTAPASTSASTEPVNPFLNAVKKFDGTKAQALKAFEKAWNARTAK